METSREKLLSIILNDLLPIKSLSVQDKNTIIGQAILLTYEAGAQIFKQGDHDEFTYYLLEGELEMQSTGEPTYMLTTETDVWKSPLARMQPRLFSAKALTTVTVLQVYRNVLNAMSPKQEVKSDPSGGIEVEC